ncbi:TMV resistance protein N-like [Cucumis melo var. makuwa]|uniref:TMV resistance protein N-like n=1 Tax=Cucumis melo var. makuwa TaxID=1194695 RepID=A0A5D3D474_CUCMM|nr:TMV resistance protein N-like [Cucumis melo var. makuwa]
MVGFYGIGGIGKTTLAKALYNKIANDFEGCCFLANVREASNQYRGLVELQKELLREILMDDLIKFSNLDVGISIIRDRLCSKKILLILDDVDTSEQLEALVGEHDSFGPGSMVIVTTRNKHVLVIHEFDILQSVQGLKDDEALKLFSWHAFKQSCPSSDYLDLSKRAVRYCDGLPLALEVVGEDINEVKTKLEACGCLCLEKGTTKLMNLSLLTIDEHSNRIEMHDLIQQMGRTIHLLETSTSHKRKRLLIKDDVMDVLSGNKEARGVKVIKLNFPKPTELDIDSRTFEKVRNLVVLDIRNATSSKSTDLQYLPNSLRWIKWPHFPFSSLPSTYTMDNLIQLKLPHSSIKHFGKAFMCGEWSKEIDLRASKFLVEIPDLTTAINLKKLDLEGFFPSLNDPSSPSLCPYLTSLMLADCCKLLEEIPNIPEGVVCMDAGGYKSMNNSITFLLPADHLSWKRKALFVPCFKFEVTNYEDWRFALKCKVFINGIQVWDSQSSLTCFPDWGRSFRGYDESRGGEYMSMIVIDPCLHFHPFGDDNMDNSREIDLNQPCFGINSSGSNLDEFKFEVEPFPELRDVIIKMFGVHIITRE